MKRPDGTKGTLLPRLIAALLLLLVGYAAYQHLQSRKEDLGFSELLQRYDGLISSGRVSEARDAAGGFSGMDLSGRQYLQLLKRFYSLSENGGGDDLLFRYSSDAVAAYPGREEFWALYSYVLCIRGNAEKAFSLAEQRLKSEEFLGFVAEAALRAGKGIPADLLKRAEKSEYRYAGLIQIPGTGNPDMLRSAGAEWNVCEFTADAALLYAEQGDVAAADELLKQSSGGKFPELSLQIAYDAGDSTFGLSVAQSLEGTRADSDPLLQLYKAGFLIDIGNPSDALAVYRNLIRRTPEYSIIPYVNAGVLDSANENEYLQQGIEKFPDSVTLLERLGENYYRNGNGPQAADLFSRVLEIDPSRGSARLRLADIRRGAGSLASDARLWDAYQEEPYGSELGVITAWRLFGRRDVSGLRLLAELQEKRMGPDLDVIRGLYRTASGQYRAAAESFGSAYEKHQDDWEYLYDQALLLSYVGDYETAIDAYQRVNGVLDQRDNVSKEEKSLIWLGLGEAQIGVGDNRNALFSLDYALDLDPGNLRASLLRTSVQAE